MWNKRIQLNGNHNIEWRWSITNITQCDTWRVTETEGNVTMRNMTPTIILVTLMTLITASQTLFFGGVRNARQNDM